MPLSTAVERTKRAIRARYQGRVENYFFDTIMHIADNHTQSRYMRRVLEPDISARDILSILDEYEYALVKVDVPYMPTEFPDKIPVGCDMDVLCRKEDAEEIAERLASHCGKKYKDYDVRVVKKELQVQIRFELYGRLIFLVDCIYAHEGLPQEFVDLGLQSRVRDERGFYRLEIGFEAVLHKAVFGDELQKEYYLPHLGETSNAENIEEKMMEHRGLATDALLPELDAYLSENNIPIEDTCIVGSSILDIMGIRKADDLDFIMLSKYHGKDSNRAVKVTASEKVERVRQNWLRGADGRVIFTDDEIIGNPELFFWYRGHKVARLAALVFKKSFGRREKDLRDLELITSSLQAARKIT